MALKTKVKINRITNLTDARYCSGMYVDILGFSFEEGTPNYISPTQFQEITGWLAGIDFAAEFTDSDAYTIEKRLADYPGISWIESTNLDALIQLKSLGKGLIYRLDYQAIESFLPQLAFLNNHQITLHLTSIDKLLSIDNKDGGYRLAGPKFSGVSGHPILTANLTEREIREIRDYMTKALRKSRTKKHK